MKGLKIFASTALIFPLLGCHSVVHSPVISAQEAMPLAFMDQARLFRWVVDAEIAEPTRSLVHVSNVCNLVIDQQEYAVVDMRELSRGAMVPRGVNQILLLNPGQQLVQKIEYGQGRPLFCEKNKLYLYDKIMLDGAASAGNVLIFAEFGFKVTVSQEDLNSRLPLPR